MVDKSEIVLHMRILGLSRRWHVTSKSFLDATPCSVVGGYQLFRGSCCLHVHREDGDSMDFW